MATPDEYEALYREGKEIEAKEESDTRLPDMAGSTDFYELLGRALAEAKEEGGKIEIHFDHPTQVRIQVFGMLRKSRNVMYGQALNADEFQFRRELTHYL